MPAPVRRFPPLYSLFVLILFCGSAFGSEIATDRLSVGDGFNSTTGEPGGNCAVFDPGHEKDDLYVPGGVTGQKTVYDFYEITSLDQLKTALNVSASASFGYGIFSADASFSFMKSGSYNSYHNYLFVQIRVTNPTEILKKKSLSPAALQYAATNRFFETCGNEFIYARTTGGDLTGIIELSSSSVEEHDKLSAAMNVAINGFLASGGGSASFSQAIDTVKNVAQTRVHIIRNGGLGDIPNIDTLQAAALKFPSSVQLITGHPVIDVLITQPYTVTDNLPGNLKFDLVKFQMDTLPRLASWLDEAYQIRGDLKFILDHPSQFYVKTADVSQLWNSNEDTIQSLLSQADTCRTKPATGCKLPPPPSFADVQTLANRACDLNKDGVIDHTDVALLLDYIMGKPGGVRADLNNDGRIDLLDLQSLIKAAVSGACRLRM